MRLIDKELICAQFQENTPQSFLELVCHSCYIEILQIVELVEIIVLTFISFPLNGKSAALATPVRRFCFVVGICGANLSGHHGFKNLTGLPHVFGRSRACG